MKWLRTIVLFDKGGIVKDADWAAVHESYRRSIQSIDHPAGSGKLTLRKEKRTDTGYRLCNGVPYLRSRFLDHIVKVEKWKPEVDVNLHPDRLQPMLTLFPGGTKYQEPVTSKFGGFDFVTVGKGGLTIAIEWETGNISSSHRSMNKLAISLAAGAIDVGVLIVPSRECYDHLTDRIGNIGELSGYLEIWEAAKERVKRGLLAITVVEHDELTEDEKIPYLPLGGDGRAKTAKGKIPKPVAILKTKKKTVGKANKRTKRPR